MSKSSDKDKGYIYLIKNKVTGESYVGQTTEFKSTMKDHIKLRFLNHLADARRNSDSNRLICKAINKYGKDNFTVEHLATVPYEDLDAIERHYIAKYITMAPNGYNMTTGGKGDSTFCEESKKKISKSQFGNRRPPKKRKHKEDQGLPKYIVTTKNKQKEIAGYIITGFPVGVNERKYISKKFMTSDLSLDELLIVTKQCRNDWQVKYSDKIEENKKQRKDNKTKKTLQCQNYKDHKLEPCTYTLPKGVTEIKKDNKVIGYSVSGFKNKDGTPRPKQDFTSKDLLHENLLEAFKHKNKLPQIIKDEAFLATQVDDITCYTSNELPKYIYFESTKDKLLGYTVKKVVTEDGVSTVVKKKFSDTKIPLEEKYKKATAYLATLLGEPILIDTSEEAPTPPPKKANKKVQKQSMPSKKVNKRKLRKEQAVKASKKSKPKFAVPSL